MDNYEQQLKETLINLRFSVLSEYAKICSENGIGAELILLANDVKDFVDLCDQAQRYYREKSSTMSAYQSGAYAVNGDQTTADYLERVKIRYSTIFNKIKHSALSDSEQSALVFNIIIAIADVGNGYFGFIPNSTDFLHEMIASLNDDYLLKMYNKLNRIKYPFIKSVKSIVDSRGLQAAKAKSGGCYVATCVYGSYDCPQVWTLRRFRDEILADSIFGRMFIKFYYAVSPTAVKLFGKKEWFHKLFKTPLDRLVKKLQEKGIDNTPYQD